MSEVRLLELCGVYQVDARHVVPGPRPVAGGLGLPPKTYASLQRFSAALAAVTDAPARDLYPDRRGGRIFRSAPPDP
ncbi:hypothetical protein ACIG56_02375 [Nocardia fusca]|uniref:hypothetical protein n=1 Tax=Nocardia fusca TaxID=941183 RepID=UPI0037CC83AB